MGTAGIEGNADDAFELVGRPRRPGAPAAAAPAKPAPQSTHEVGNSLCWEAACCCCCCLVSAAALLFPGWAAVDRHTLLTG